MAVEGAESNFDRSLPLPIFDRRSLGHLGQFLQLNNYSEQVSGDGASLSNSEMKPFDTNPIVSVAGNCLFGFFQWALGS